MTKKYTLTEEHKAQFPAWRDKWIADDINSLLGLKPVAKVKVPA